MSFDLKDFRRRWYRSNRQIYYMYFDKDFSFRKHFGHRTNTKIFPNHKNILLFLELNPEVKIYFTLDDTVKPFRKVDDGFLINMSSYTDFCRTVNNSDGGKVAAFLGQNLGLNDISITAEDSNDYIKRNATESIVVEVFKQFDPETQSRLITLLNSLTSKTVKTDTVLKAEISNALDKVADLDEEQLEKALDKTKTPSKVKTIVKSLNQAELKNVSSTYKHDLYKSELGNLEKLLELEDKNIVVQKIVKHAELIKYQASQPEKIFQNWVERNQWVFGIEYIKKYDATKIALFSDADLLMESMDGFLDLIELKRPKLKSELLIYDASHKSYFPSSDLSAAIGQSLYYLKKLEEYKMNVEKEHKAQVIMPRVKIIVGRTADFNIDQFAALRVLNSNLNRIQVVSYDYLLSCGAQIIKSYET